MKYLACVVLIGFAGMALFSFLGMGDNSHHMGTSSRDCLASLIQNGACPPRPNTVESGVFHTTSFATFALAVVTFMVLAFSVPTLLRFLTVRNGHVEALRPFSLGTLSPRHRRWLALLIQSPALKA